MFLEPAAPAVVLGLWWLSAFTLDPARTVTVGPLWNCLIAARAGAVVTMATQAPHGRPALLDRHRRNRGAVPRGPAVPRDPDGTGLPGHPPTRGEGTGPPTPDPGRAAK
ncbi:hypothetical protein [Streptomyces sp. WELS2]|uniref:hypothetical protein n=1 Tax=Streptomyces sp. WELS2 TaxID=2749435 RepID=UPI00215DA259|nr:hypothetical protein [Streptomyces sp. WELS2]